MAESLLLVRLINSLNIELEITCILQYTCNCKKVDNRWEFLKICYFVCPSYKCCITFTDSMHIALY